MTTLDNGVKDRIEKEISDNDVVLFMKGVDVLAEPSLREGIKVFSDWPTIPQLYVKGEFVGGCDIIKEMYENGELQELFSK